MFTLFQCSRPHGRSGPVCGRGPNSASGALYMVGTAGARCGCGGGMLTTSDRATRSVMLRESGFDCAKNNSANHQRTPGRRARNFGSGSVERSTSSKSCAENSAKGASGAGQKELVVQNVFASGPILGYP